MLALSLSCRQPSSLDLRIEGKAMLSAPRVMSDAGCASLRAMVVDGAVGYRSRMFIRVITAILVSAVALPALAQSPNTASTLIVAVDQTGAVVGDAKVTVINSATGAV